MVSFFILADVELLKQHQHEIDEFLLSISSADSIDDPLSQHAKTLYLLFIGSRFEFHRILYEPETVVDVSFLTFTIKKLEHLSRFYEEKANSVIFTKLKNQLIPLISKRHFTQFVCVLVRARKYISDVTKGIYICMQYIFDIMYEFQKVVTS